MDEHSIRRNAEARAESEKIGLRVSNSDFRIRMPPGFTLSEAEGVWTMRDEAGQPWLSMVASDTRSVQPGGPAPADAWSGSGRRRGRDYWLHIWPHDLPPQDAAYARRISNTISLHQ